MKSFTSMVVLAAFFLSSTAFASLTACKHVTDYKFEGSDYSPSPMSPSKEVCITIDGKFKTTLPSPGSKLKIEVDQGEKLHGDWSIDLMYEGGSDDDSNPMKHCFFLPPSFENIDSDSRVSVRLSLAHPSDQDQLLMCVQGTITVA